MVRKKKEHSQEDALHIELTPARKLRQEITQSNALLIYARLGWGGIGLPKNNTPPVGSLPLRNAIIRYYNTITSATTLTDIERAYADLHRETENALYEHYQHSGVTKEELASIASGERILQIMTAIDKNVGSDPTISEALDTVITMRKALGNSALPIMATITDASLLETDIKNLSDRIDSNLREEKRLTSKATLSNEEKSQLEVIRKTLTLDAMQIRDKEHRLKNNISVQDGYRNLIDAKSELIDKEEAALLSLQTYKQYESDQEQLQQISLALNMGDNTVDGLDSAVNAARARLQAWDEVRNGSIDEANKEFALMEAGNYLDERRRNL